MTLALGPSDVCRELHVGHRSAAEIMREVGCVGEGKLRRISRIRLELYLAGKRGQELDAAQERTLAAAMVELKKLNVAQADAGAGI